MKTDGSLTIECVKAINQIGHTTYQNICNGTVSNVSWGLLDWVGAGIMVLGSLILVGGLVLIVSIIKEMKSIY